ncbi:MAG: type II secretion system protein [Cloacibacillus sp.]
MKAMRKKAFTLVELLIAIIIIGVLAGLMMISAGGATDKANVTRCVADRRSIKSALNIYRAEHGGYEGFSDKLKDMFDNYNGAGVETDKIKGICPIDGIYTITSEDQKVIITCSLHSDSADSAKYYTDEEIKNMFGRLHETYTYKDRYKQPTSTNNRGEPGSLDSNGAAKAGLLIEDLTKRFPELDISAYSWRLIVNEGGNYDFYLTKDKFTNETAVGTPIKATKYSFDAGGNCSSSEEINTTVEEKEVNGNTPIKVIKKP